MNTDQLLGIVRHLLTSAGGALVSHGLISSSQASDGVGAIMVLIGIGWSIYTKTEAAKAAQAVKAVQNNPSLLSKT